MSWLGRETKAADLKLFRGLTLCEATNECIYMTIVPQ